VVAGYHSEVGGSAVTGNTTAAMDYHQHEA
jgi:hypothetical protein